MTALEQLFTGSESSRVIIVPPVATPGAIPGQIARRVRSAIEASTWDRPERAIWEAGDHSGRRWESARRSLTGGVVHFEADDDIPVLVVRRKTGLRPNGPIHVGSGGGLRQIGEVEGRPVVLRVGLIDTSGDPTHHYSALRSLEGLPVPSALGSGTEADTRWSLESLVDGTRYDELSIEHIRGAGDFLAGLPKAAGPPRFSAANDPALIEAPRALRSLSERMGEHLAQLPAVMTHGDFWAGNLLFEGSRLAGVLDWDSWMPEGVPGVDLLHLFAERARRRDRLSYGSLVREEFWKGSDVVEALREYLASMGVGPGDVHVPWIAFCWWRIAVAGALGRNPTLWTSDRWLERNVQTAASHFAAMLSTV